MILENLQCMRSCHPAKNNYFPRSRTQASSNIQYYIIMLQTGWEIQSDFLSQNQPAVKEIKNGEISYRGIRGNQNERKMKPADDCDETEHDSDRVVSVPFKHFELPISILNVHFSWNWFLRSFCKSKKKKKKQRVNFNWILRLKKSSNLSIWEHCKWEFLYSTG